MFINAYQSLANNIHEVRTDLGRMREATGEYIKKDDFNARNTTIWNGIRDAQAVLPTVTVLTSKISGLEAQRAASDIERTDLHRELLQLRERIAKLEGLQEAKPVKPAAHAEPAKAPSK
jgi:regulator of replication initiation timing